MDIITPVLGGLALFLFGMTIMGEGLQKSSGNKLKKIVGSLTRNKYIGVLLGIVVTMVIQSSSAATVMVVGFVNAGLMPLNQAVGVIIGANVGTTITAQIIAFDIAKYAPLIVAFGVLLYISAKDDRKKNLGEVFVGLGLIFIGMNTMGDGLNPLSKELWFKNALLKLNSPVIGVFVGFFLTTAVQSSSASIGLIQALGKQGLLTINQAAPLLLGGNIGTTTTALLSSIGAGKNAKRAAIIHLLFNLIGTVIVL
ncbi:MAG: Na/Pi symporter, partial [Finegoldia magna]|nr:Na/Pi symporter [Finegoldia magna]